MARKKEHRSEWGTIITRRNARGEVTSYQARYTNPLDPRKRVQRNFKPDQKLRAANWLESEHELVRRFELGQAQWTHPSQREQAAQARDVLFKDYAQDYFDHYHAPDGSELSTASYRKKQECVRHLIAAFGTKRLTDLSTSDVDAWLNTSTIGPYALHRSYQTLKAIMKQAATATPEAPALIEHSPCIHASPKLPRSRQATIPPATMQELEAIYQAMPDYSRIAVYLSAVFGLRIGEVCALQRQDFDFTRLVLHVRHSVGRGPGDTGQLLLKATKTDTSNADLPIPQAFVPMLQEHLKAYCKPGPEAMVVPAASGGIMSTGTLRQQFDQAKQAAHRPDLHFHTLRATAITAAAQTGASPKETQRFGRHADPEISLALYQRATDDGERRVADNVFKAIVSPPRTREVVKAERDQAAKELEALQQLLAALDEELAGLQ
ncbi:hypothetical protein KIM372_03290 [Bombiscardovia nodaiensis]|uniref:Tyr recombinase domain-containing protein n=1 Tax=Bombiscardovia nodaiensis TaxID=2932181 RepID=A0ABM8B6X6_9BIFI|nr:hypothetical protein KIM372_03290 [Bombiscardovia nodaiensis]